METKRSTLNALIDNFQPSYEDIWFLDFHAECRFIFENQQYTEKEQNYLRKLKSCKIYSQLDTSYWNDAQLLRWIQASNNKVKDAVANIKKHNKWRTTVVPNKYLIHEVMQFLVL